MCDVPHPASEEAERGAVKQMLEKFLNLTAREKSQALKPLRFPLGAAFALGAYLLWHHESWAQTFGVIVIGIWSVFWMGWYSYFALKSPDRLGSERFFTDQRILQIAEESKDPALLRTVTVDTVERTVTTEEKARSLSDGRPDREGE